MFIYFTYIFVKNISESNARGVIKQKIEKLKRKGDTNL